MKVLVVCAHPDDEVLGPGGTILNHARSGDDVSILLACCGDNLRYGREQTVVMRGISESVAARLGAQRVMFGELPDQGLDAMSLSDVARSIEDAVLKIDPQIIYTHHWGDINRDHRILSEAVMVATRPFAAPGVRGIHCFETPSATEWGPAAGLLPFVPQRFVDISRVLDRKLDAFSLYPSEVRPYPHPRSREALEARARFWGSAAGLPAAEAFAVSREIC